MNIVATGFRLLGFRRDSVQPVFVEDAFSCTLVEASHAEATRDDGRYLEVFGRDAGLDSQVLERRSTVGMWVRVAEETRDQRPNSSGGDAYPDCAAVCLPFDIAAVVVPCGHMEEPVQELLRLSMPSRAYSSSDASKAHRLAVATECFLRSRMEAFLRQHSDGPIALSYQADETPEITFERCDIHLFGQWIKRGGFRTGEYLLDRLFARTATDMNVLFRCPVRLANKTGWAHLAAASQVILFPWNFGCVSINIFHIVVDGAVYSTLRDLLHRLHQKDLQAFCATLPEGDGRLLRVCSWYVSTQCVNHSAHNSFKNALKESFSDEALLKDMWGTIEGLRTCYITLMEFARLWVCTRLVFQDWEMEQGAALWSMLGFNMEMAERLNDLQIRVVGDIIYVAEKCKGDPSIIDTIVDVVSACCRWRKWTDSRWCSIGDSSRSLLTSLLLGIESLVAFALSRGHSAFYLAKAKQVSPAVKRLTVQASVVGFVADAALGILLTDDRLPVVYTELMAEVDSEVSYVLNIPMEMWAFLGRCLGLEPIGMRSDAVHGALASAAALKEHFQVATEPPWSLVRTGDIEEEVAKLAEGPQPTEAVSWAVWQLCRVGYPRPEVLEGLQLLRLLPWSQVSTEQGHSAGSVAMKKHRLMGQAMLQSRSMLRQAACLFRECPEQVKLNRLRDALGRLRKYQPQKMGARQAYISEVLLLAAELRPDTNPDADLARRLVARCGERWNRLSDDHKHRYFLKAQVLVAERCDALEGKKQEALQAIRKQRCVVEKAMALGATRVGSCRFSDGEVEAFGDVVKSNTFAGKSLTQYRVAMETAVTPPAFAGAGRLDEVPRRPGD